jgi:hypothetical protein
MADQDLAENVAINETFETEKAAYEVKRLEYNKAVEVPEGTTTGELFDKLFKPALVVEKIIPSVPVPPL